MWLKRAFDLCFSALALLLFLPLLVLLGVWIKADSSGPVFFRQTRVGRLGQPFDILKLRTMRVDSADSQGPQLTVGADPRITRAGKFLRHYKLDELPQFLNVLLGDMSVVGPRPEVPRYVDKYPPDVRRIVMSVRPGITDLASVEFRDESTLLAASDDPERTYVEVVLPRKLRIAVDYVQRRTLRLDLAIIWRTIAALVMR